MNVSVTFIFLCTLINAADPQQWHTIPTCSLSNLRPWDINPSVYTLKKIDFFPNPWKRFCRCQKACKWVEMAEETIQNSATPGKVLHIDTPKESSLQNLSRLRRIFLLIVSFDIWTLLGHVVCQRHRPTPSIPFFFFCSICSRFLLNKVSWKRSIWTNTSLVFSLSRSIVHR